MVSEQSSAASVCKPVGILAGPSPGREILQIMMALKGFLQDAGISISLTDPEVYILLLQSSRDLDEPTVQELRARLLELEPPHACLYEFEQESGELSCGRCEQLISVEVPEGRSRTKPLRLSCPNCKLPFAAARTE